MSTMSLDIPSVSSTDLNKLLSHMFASIRPPGSENGVWNDSDTAVIVIEDDSDSNRSPEPSTPHFGSRSAPTFEESVAQFGFSFTKVPGPLLPDRKDHCTSTTGELSIDIGHASRAHVKSNEVSNVIQNVVEPDEQPQEMVAEKDVFESISPVCTEENLGSPLLPNIPRVVLELELCHPTSYQSVSIPNLSVIPATLPGGHADNPTSFIKFLNDPIAIPPELMVQMKQSEDTARASAIRLDAATASAIRRDAATATAIRRDAATATAIRLEAATATATRFDEEAAGAVDEVQAMEEGEEDVCMTTEPDSNTCAPMYVQQAECSTATTDSIQHTLQSAESVIRNDHIDTAGKHASYIQFLAAPDVPSGLGVGDTHSEHPAPVTPPPLDETSVTEITTLETVIGDTYGSSTISYTDVLQTEHEAVTRSDVFPVGNVYDQPIIDDCSTTTDIRPTDSYIPTDVAAYQLVDESTCIRNSTTYTELTPVFPSEEESSSLVHIKSDCSTHDANGTDCHTFEIAEVMADCDNVLRDVEHKLQSRSVPGARNLLKSMLNRKIQTKRLQEGKGKLKVTFEKRPISEPSTEEKKKAETRKQNNRDSAVKSRVKRQQFMDTLEQEVKILDRENRRLAVEIEKLKTEKERDLKLLTEHCDCFNSEQGCDSNTVSNKGSNPSIPKSLSQALSEFFSLMDNS